MAVGWRVKRWMDVAIAASALVLLAPSMGLISVAIRLSMGRPILFRQIRPGCRGRPFELVKFRTMSDARTGEGGLRPDDERTTRLGAALRRVSLDELPELWNILMGDMSLVGPRPLLMEYLGRYSPEQARRHLVRPGLTGLAQVQGRRQIPMAERFALDVWYVDHWSLALDLRILGRTALKVIEGEGVRPDDRVGLDPFQSLRSSGPQTSDPEASELEASGADAQAAGSEGER